MADKSNRKPAGPNFSAKNIILANQINSMDLRDGDASEDGPNGARSAAGPRHNLPERHRRFVGRETELEEIHRRLNESKEVGVTQQMATHAQGGVGKTALAHEYAWRHLDDYPGGLFVVGCDVAELLPAMAELAAPLGIEECDTPEETVQQIKLALSHGEPSLLILDNVNDDAQWTREGWAKWLPGGKCRRLITTRAIWLSDVDMLPLERLPRAKGIELLAKYRADAGEAANEKVAGDIVDWFDGLAVGLTVVGVYMQKHKDLSWDQYAQSLATRGLGTVRDTEKRVGHLPNYDKRVDSVFDDALKALTKPQRRAMEYAALLPEGTVLDHWLGWLLAKDDSIELPEAPPGYEGRPAEAVVAELRELGLLTPARTGENVLALHRVLRRRLRELLGKNNELRERLLDGVVALAEFRGKASHDVITDKPLRAELSPLVALVEELEASDRFWPAVSLANWIHTPLDGLGRHRENQSQLTRLESRVEDVNGEVDEKELAMLLGNLALALKSLGDLRGARSRMERAIEVGEHVHNADHPNLAIRYSNLAMVLQDLGDLSGARSRMERAIEIGEMAYDANHPQLAIYYSNLALILQDLGDVSGARSRIKRAIEIDEDAYDADHPLLATRYRVMAYVVFGGGNAQEALEWEERAFAILMKHFDDDHPHVKTCKQFLAKYRAAVGQSTQG